MSRIRICLRRPTITQAIGGNVHVASGHRDTEFARGVEAPLRQFHRRQLGGAGRTAAISTISARSPASRYARSPARKPPTSSLRSTPRIRPRTPGHTPRLPSARRCSTRSPTAWRRICELLAAVETIDNGKPIRETTLRRHSARHRSFPLFRGLHPCAGRLAVGDRCTTPSPITITSRWASSARSSPGTSRS